MSMLRRTFIAGAAAFSALPLPKVARAGAARPKVGVVGAGILGASIAMRLAQAGAEVVVFERTAPASGATRNSVAWINPIILDAHYVQMRLLSMKSWLEVDRAFGLGGIWGGGLSWADGPTKGAALTAKMDLLRGTADEARAVTADEIPKVSPGVLPGDKVSSAYVTPADGHVDPVFATERLLAAAKGFGAKVLYPCEVTAIEQKGGKLSGVVTSQGAFPLDHLVTAVGTDTTKVMELVGYKLGLRHAPGLVVHTDPQPVVTKMVYEASGVIEFKQYADGRFLTSFTAGPPDLPVHAGIRAHPMDYPNEGLRQFHGQMLIRKTAAFIPAIAPAKPTQVLVGFRPMPLDRRPVMGPVPGAPGVYVVVTHSGVTLAPIIGEYVAREVLGGAQEPILAPYRPQRFDKA
jgi:glycine/D-amino acid oxidase-like deaminating enzyme